MILIGSWTRTALSTTSATQIAIIEAARDCVQCEVRVTAFGQPVALMSAIPAHVKRNFTNIGRK